MSSEIPVAEGRDATTLRARRILVVPWWVVHAIGPLLVAAVFLVLARWTYLKWFDPIIDFGRELYAPWRLTEGDHLYRDIAWFNGPISAYLNAAIFAVFGVSIATLVRTNLLLLVLLTGLLYVNLRDLSDRVTATAGCLVFLCLFAFGHFSFLGNFNFVSPYSHEVTHGLLLSVGALTVLRRWRPGSSRWPLLVGGFLLGCSFLTKAEVFLAAVIGSAIGIGLTAKSGDLSTRRMLGTAGSILGAALVPVAVSLVLLAGVLPPREALIATLGNWPWVVEGEVGRLIFYQKLMGTLDLRRSAAEMALSAAKWAAVLGAGLLLSWCFRARDRRVELAAIAIVPTLSAILLRAVGWKGWVGIFRPLPLFVAILTVCLATTAWRRRDLGPVRVWSLAWCGFALALESKILLAVDLAGYGFALAAPAAMITTAALVYALPRWLVDRGRAGGVFRAVALGVLGAVMLGNLAHASGWLSRKNVPLGSGDDAFLTDRRGQVLRVAIDELRSIVRPGERMTVLPEGVMLNYLTRTPSASRHINFMPPEMVMFDERRIVEDLAAGAPEYVLVVHRPTPDYGMKGFGSDFGRQILSWVRDRYRPVIVYGDRPFSRGADFGIELLIRSAGVDAPPTIFRAQETDSSPARGGQSGWVDR